jgi:predicted Zn-dependent peptidase
VDHLGAELDAAADWDETAVGLSVPSERLEPALAILSDVVRKPAFPAEELDRVRRELLTTFLQWRDEPESIARVAFARAVYGDHPYGRVTEGTEAFVRTASREDLERFHRTAFVPGNAAIVAAGDVTAANLKTLLEGAFGSWTGTGERRPRSLRAAGRGRSIWIVDIPDAAQSEIRIGRVGRREHSGLLPILIANTILGGSFTSRLNQNLREQHGYAYGAGSAFDFRLSTGPFLASGAVQTDKTAPALAEFFKELEGMRRPVSEEELSRARNYLALRYPRGFETTGQLVGRLEAKVVYDLPDDYFTTYMDRVARGTAQDFSRVAAKSMDPSSGRIVVGDRRKIEPGFAAEPRAVRVFTVDQILGKAAPAVERKVSRLRPVEEEAAEADAAKAPSKPRTSSGDLLLHPRSDRRAHPDRAADPLLHHERDLSLVRLSLGSSRVAPLPPPPPENRPRLQEVARLRPTKETGDDPQGKGTGGKVRPAPR